MQKYITKNNVLNAILFTQFIVVTIPQVWDVTPEMGKWLSFIGLVAGYFINLDK